MEKCYKLIERQMYPEALNYLTQILRNEISNPRLETIFLIHSILNLSQRYKTIQIKLLELITPEENDEERFCSLTLDLINLYIDSNSFKAAKNASKKLRNYVEEIPNNESFIYIIDNVDKMLAYNQKNVDPKEQLETYETFIQLEKKQRYFEQDGMPAYLIPARWFNKWKSYVQGTQIESQEDVFEGQKEIENLRNLLDVSSDIDIEEQIFNPGPINGFSLIQLVQNLQLDPFSPKQYSNYILRDNLREGIDYILVGYKIYEYFKNIYGGFDIKRLIVEHHSTHQKYVDLVPRLIQYLTMPLDEQPSIKQITANSSDLLSDITKKIMRIMKIKGEIRWWKFKDVQGQQEYLKKLQRRELYKTINAQILDKTTRIEEINFSSVDLFICEIKQGKEWMLSVANTKSEIFSRNRFNVSNVPTLVSDSRKGLTGLQNLGNTCFMNAALQCLSNTYELTEYMVSNQFESHLNYDNPLGTRGQLATAYAELMKTMWYGNNSAVSAYDLKKVIGKFAPQFYGYGQQDSHEFLSYLLDGLHEDLNRVLNKPIVKDVEITNETDDEASRIFWDNYTKRNQSKIQQLMVGQYKSTLICPNCQRTSKTFDPYMSLSLPIPSYQLLQISLYFIYSNNQIPSKIWLNVTSDEDAKTIAQELERATKIETSQMNFVLIKDHQIKERVTQKTNVKQISEHEGQLFVMQVDKEFHSLPDNYVHVDYYYCCKSDKFYRNEQILTFPRQLVMLKTDKNIDLHFQIYSKFKPYLIFIFEECQQWLIKDDLIEGQLTDQVPETLEQYLEEMKLFKEVPFQLQYRAKTLAIDSDAILETLNSKVLSVNVVLNPRFTKFNITNLRLQRCKDLSIEQTKQTKKGEYTLEDCLKLFSKQEVLGKGDEWYCNKCKLHVQATKQMEIYRAPKLLVVHLKRFRSAHNRINNYGNFFYTGGSQKVTTMIHFPKSLNMNKFILSKEQDNDPIDYQYELYGVDNHYGGLGGGHYTACAYNSLLNKWIDYNDSSARVASSNDIQSEAAYVLFYRRRDSEKCSLGK